MKVILIRYSEIHLKGNNKEYFESALVNNIKLVLKDFDCEFNKKKTLSSIAYKKLFGKGEGE